MGMALDQADRDGYTGRKRKGGFTAAQDDGPRIKEAIDLRAAAAAGNHGSDFRSAKAGPVPFQSDEAAIRRR
jgi:hypothetical protein